MFVMPLPPRATKHLAALVDDLLDPFFAVDEHWRFTLVNRHAAVSLGASPDELLGRVLWDVFREARGTPLAETYHHVMLTREVSELEVHDLVRGVWVEVRAFPHDAGVGVHFRDVTDRKLAAQRRERLLDVSRALASATTERDVVTTALDVALPACDAYAGLVLLLEGQGTDRQLGPHFARGYDEQDVRAWAPYALETRTPVTDTARTGEAVFVRTRDLPDWPVLARDKSERTRAVAALPLVAGDEVYGVLALSFDHDRTFNGAERDFLRSVSAQFAVAFDRVRLAERTRRQADVAAFLAEASELLGGSLDVHDVTERLTRLAVPRLADWCGVYLPDGEIVEVAAVAHTDPVKERELRGLVSQVPMRLDDQGGAPEIIRTGRTNYLPVVTDEMLSALKRDPRQVEWVLTLGMRSALGVPLRANGRVLGAIQLVQAESGRHFSDEDVTVAQDLAHRAALAISNARLYRASQVWAVDLEQQVRDRTADLERAAEELRSRTRALEAFSTLTQNLTSDDEPLALVHAAQEALLSLLPQSAVTYYELDRDRWRLRSLAGQVRHEELERTLREGIAQGQVPNLDVPYGTKAPLYQARYEPGEWDDGTDLTRHVQATAALPVLVEGDVTGVLVVGSFEHHEWPDTHRAVLETGVRQLGLALHRARALRDLRARNAALVELNEELDAFTSTISHDLRAPLRHAGAFAELLRREAGDEGRPGLFARQVVDATQRMTRMVEGLLGYARASRASFIRTEVPLAELVEAVRYDLTPELEGREVRWIVGDLPVVPGDRAALRSVMANLLSNAVKYTREQDIATIEVGATIEDGEATVFVRDDGAGFDPARVEALFSTFSRLHDDARFEGVGLGLAAVRRVVARHGGRVWAESTPGKGATFSLTLPLAGDHD